MKRRDALIQLLDRYGVEIIFFGDEHNYSRVRIDGKIGPVAGCITQIITGGAGAPYYELAEEIPWQANLEKFGRENHFVLVDVGEKVTVRVIGITGHTLDEFELN